MAFIKVSGKKHTDFPEVGILAWGEAKQQRGVTSHHPCRARVSSCKCSLLLMMDQAPFCKKRVHCFENHYRRLLQLSSLVHNSLIQKGALKCIISAQSSWVLVLHSSWWYWMAEQGSGIGVGGGQRWDPQISAITNNPQSAGSSQKPESTAQGNNFGALTPLQWVAQVSWVSANTFSAQRNLKILGLHIRFTCGW